MTRERVDTTEDERRVACPRCGAPGNVACVTAEGIRRREAHIERALAAIVELLRPITTTPSRDYIGSLRADKARAIGEAVLAGIRRPPASAPDE
jgi:hypothetical protein